MTCVSEVPARRISEKGSDNARYAFYLPFTADCTPTTVYVNLAGREVDFIKTPDWGKSKIVTGALPTGVRQKDFLCFAWDIDNTTLYLDLNRNLNVTDDPSGVYQSTKDSGRKVQRFSNITIETDYIPVRFPHNPVRIPYTVDITLRKTRSKANCIVTVRSGWQGDIELDGTKMRLTVKDNLDCIIKKGDRLYMMPFDDNARYPDESSTFNSFIIPRSIAFGEHDYIPAYEFVYDEVGSRLKVAFTRTIKPSGKLRIKGHNHVRRLILKESDTKGSSQVILDSPGEEVRIPVGTYNRQVVFLDGGIPFGIFESTFTDKMTINEEETAVLQTGIPLTNTLSVKRSGPVLHIDYILAGTEGQKYIRLITRDNYYSNNATQPKFSIYRDGEKITSGSFRYG